MIRNMITAAVLTATLATQAAAFDTYTISRHGAWDVTLTANSDGMYCAASTENNRGETFDLTIYPTGTLQLFLLFDGQEETAHLDLDVHIGGAPAWELDQVFFTPGGAMFEFGEAHTAVEFVVDLQKGTTVAISLRDQRKRYGNWSLTGSRAAIDSLFECFRRISGVGA